MTRSGRFAIPFSPVALVLFVVGCSSDVPPPKLPDAVKVSGNVSLDSQPIDGVTIRFAPTTDQGYHGATGQTDSSGNYELFTDIGNGESRPGVIPGSYLVYLSRLVKADGTVVPPNPNVPPMMSGARESIPMKYSSGQKYEVKAEGGTFDLKLDSKPEQNRSRTPGFPGGPGPAIPGSGPKPGP